MRSYPSSFIRILNGYRFACTFFLGGGGGGMGKREREREMRARRSAEDLVLDQNRNLICHLSTKLLEFCLAFWQDKIY